MKTMLNNLAAIAQNTQSDNIRMIDIDELHESAANFFEIERIEEFAYTILGQGGVKDNLIVRPLESGGYEIISGHRRRAAVQYLLDHGESISRLLPCLIQSYEDEDSMMLDLILMNVSARQLSDQELWQCYEKLNSILQSKKEAGERFGRVRETIAQILGVSPSQVGKLQNVDRNAIEPVKEAVANGDISISTANVIAQLDEEQQEELAAGDLSKVTHKEAKKAAKKAEKFSASEDTSSPDPVTVKWDGETQKKIVKKQLMYFVNDKLREEALTMNGMDFQDAFRKQNKDKGCGFSNGIFILGSYDRITISFSAPEKHDNIRKIEITWRMAAKFVQQWIQEDAEKVDTCVNLSEDEVNEADEPETESADDQEFDGQFTFTGDAEREPQEIEVKDELTDRYHEDAEKVVSVLKHQHRQTMIGYLTLTLQAMGMNAETISDAQLMMYQVLDTKSDAEAREAYRGA